jgi:hypothetical protein
MKTLLKELQFVLNTIPRTPYHFNGEETDTYKLVVKLGAIDNQLDQLNSVDEYSIDLRSLSGTREQLIETFEALIHSLKNEPSSELEGPYKDENCWGVINLL